MDLDNPQNQQFAIAAFQQLQMDGIVSIVVNFANGDSITIPMNQPAENLVFNPVFEVNHGFNDDDESEEEEDEEEWPEEEENAFDLFEEDSKEKPEDILADTYFINEPQADDFDETIIIDEPVVTRENFIQLVFSPPQKCSIMIRKKKTFARLTKYENPTDHNFPHTNDLRVLATRLKYLFYCDLPYESNSSQINELVNRMFQNLCGSWCEWNFRTARPIDSHQHLKILEVAQMMVDLCYPNFEALDIMKEEMQNCLRNDSSAHACWFCYGDNDTIRLNLFLTYMACRLPPIYFGSRLPETHDLMGNVNLEYIRILALYATPQRIRYMPKVLTLINKKCMKRVRHTMSDLACMNYASQITYIPARYNHFLISDKQQRALHLQALQRYINNEPEMWSTGKVMGALSERKCEIQTTIDNAAVITETLRSSVPEISNKTNDLLDGMAALMPAMKSTTDDVSGMASSAQTLITALTEVVPSLKNTLENVSNFSDKPLAAIKYTLLDLIAYLGSEVITWPEKPTIVQMGAVLYRILNYAGITASSLLSACTDLVKRVFFTSTPTQPSQGAFETEGVLENSPEFNWDTISSFVSNLFKSITNIDVPFTKLKEWGNRMQCFTKLERGFAGLLKICTKIIECLKDGFYWLRFKILKDLPEGITEDDIMNWCSDVAWFESEEAKAMVPHDEKLQEKIVELADFGLNNLHKILKLNIKNPIVQQFTAKQASIMKTFNGYYANANFSTEVFRCCPFHIVLHGEPEVGKSILSSSIINDMENMMGKPKLNRCMDRNATDQYWSGYMEQRWVRIDDAWQIKDGELAMRELADYFMMFSSVPFPLNMAQISEKGKLFRSKGVISCTNSPFPDVPACTNKTALYRRRQMLVYARRKKGSNPEEELARTGVNTNSHLIFRLTDPREPAQIANLSTLPEDAPGWLTYNDLIKECMERYIAHMSNQERLNRNILDSSDIYFELNTFVPGRKDLFDQLSKEYEKKMAQFEKVVKPMLPSHFRWNYSRDAAVRFVKDALGTDDKVIIDHVMKEAKEETEEKPSMYASFGDRWKEFKEKRVVEISSTAEKYKTMAKELASACNSKINEALESQKGYTTLKACAALAAGFGIGLAIYGTVKAVKKYHPIQRLKEYWAKQKDREHYLFTAVYFNLYMDELQKAYDKAENSANPDLKTAFTGNEPKNLQEQVQEKVYMIHYIEGLDEKEKDEAYGQLFEAINREVFTHAEAKYGGGSIMKNRHAQIPHKATVFGNKPQMDLDQNTVELIQEVSESLCVIERLNANGTVLAVGGTLVRGNVMLMPGHFFGPLPHEGYMIIKQYTTQREVTVKYSQDTVTQFDEIDIAVVNLGFVSFVKKNGKKIKLWKKFLDTKEIAKLTTTEAMFMSLDRTGSTLINQPTIARSLEMDQNINEVSGSYLAFDDTPRILSYHKGYKYRAKTGKGRCGFPLISLSNRTKGRVMSIHTSGGEIPIGHTLPYEELVKTIEKIPFNVIPPKVKDLEILDNTPEYAGSEVEHPETLFNGNFTHIGKMSKKQIPHQNTKTAIIPSLIASNPIKFPAPLKGTDKRILPEYRTERLALRNAQGYGKQLVPFDYQKSERIIKNMRVRWTAASKIISVARTPGVQSEDIALNGEVDDEFNRPIMLDTSPGYPYVIEKRDEGILDAGKAYLFNREEYPDHVHLSVGRPELRKRLDYRLEQAKKGKRVTSVWYANLKDETLKVSKIEMGKTRLFFAAPVDYAILVKRYFGDFRSMTCRARAYLPGQVGANFEGPDTTQIAERLLSRNARGLVMDGDFAGFDQCQDAQTTMLIVEQINEWYRGFPTWKEEDDVVRRVLIMEVLDTLVLVDGEVVIMHQSLPSGFQLTIDINNLINEFFHTYVWMELAERNDPRYADPTFFNKCVSMVCMGDDVLTSCVDGVDWWTMANIAAIFWEHGITYTSADKSDVLGTAKPITEVSFCKRGFKRHPFARHIWQAPLEETSLMNPTNWIHDKNLTKEDATIINAEGAVREAYYHGRKRFEEVKEEMIGRLSAVGLEMTIQDYDYFDGKFCAQFL